jgi:putative RecB family exonuclease
MCRPPLDRTIDAALADLDRAHHELADDPEFAGLELTDEERIRFHAEAEVLVGKYFELEDPTTIRPIGLELKLQAEIGSVRLRGIIDRLELDADGGLVVTDYKTGGVPSERYEGKSLSGVHTYAMLCERMLGKRPARIQLLYLAKPEAIIATPTDQTITGVERRADALWSAIVTACTRDDFRPHPSALCNYCAFQAYCPAYGGDPAQAAELHGPGTVIESELPLVVA